jgi:hypothetical protein
MNRFLDRRLQKLERAGEEGPARCSSRHAQQPGALFKL